MPRLALDPEQLRLLRGLRINPRNSFSGSVHGERLTKQRGASIDFRDYREYAEGDDLRHLDWNVFARLDTAIVKTYRDETDIAVHLWVDGSPSMRFGEPSKADLAIQLGLAFGLVALDGGESVLTRWLGTKMVPAACMRGNSAGPRLAEYLTVAGFELGNGIGLCQDLNQMVKSNLRKGIVILLSDGMDPLIADAIRKIGGRGHELWFVQILADEELEPDLEGDVKLVDCENGSFTEMTANRNALALYKKNLDQHLEGIRDAVRRINGRHIVVRSSQSFREAMRQGILKEGWLK